MNASMSSVVGFCSTLRVMANTEVPKRATQKEINHTDHVKVALCLPKVIRCILVCVNKFNDYN